MHDAAPQTFEQRADPVRSAQEAGLRYVADDEACIERRKHGKGFRYVHASGKPVRDDATLARIRSLVIPPAWTNVRICADADGHVQATGRDVKGRKQYRYHPEFRAIRDETKYDKIFDFAAALPRIRARVQADLARRDITREKVLAAAVALLDATLIRVGNEEYARLNQSFGLTTLRKRHAKITGDTVELRFRGKSGVERTVRLTDRRIVNVLKRCQGLRGELLFRYGTADGAIACIDSSDVNAYVREAAGADFTAKDFRTWAGTVIAATLLRERGVASSATAAKRELVLAVRETAQKLGNTPSVCRACYIHPAVLASYTSGVLASAPRASRARAATGLRDDERAVLAFLTRATGRRIRRPAPAAKDAA